MICNLVHLNESIIQVIFGKYFVDINGLI